MSEIVIRVAGEEDAAWLADLWRESWGDVFMVSRGRVHQLDDLATLIAWEDGRRVGAATYWIDGVDAELTSLNATLPSRGVGTALLAAVEEAVRAAGVDRL